MAHVCTNWKITTFLRGKPLASLHAPEEQSLALQVSAWVHCNAVMRKRPCLPNPCEHQSQCNAPCGLRSEDQQLGTANLGSPDRTAHLPLRDSNKPFLRTLQCSVYHARECFPLVWKNVGKPKIQKTNEDTVRKEERVWCCNALLKHKVELCYQRFGKIAELEGVERTEEPATNLPRFMDINKHEAS